MDFDRSVNGIISGFCMQEVEAREVPVCFKMVMDDLEHEISDTCRKESDVSGCERRLSSAVWFGPQDLKRLYQGSVNFADRIAEIDIHIEMLSGKDLEQAVEAVKYFQNHPIVPSSRKKKLNEALYGAQKYFGESINFIIARLLQDPLNLLLDRILKSDKFALIELARFVDKTGNTNETSSFFLKQSKGLIGAISSILEDVADAVDLNIDTIIAGLRALRFGLNLDLEIAAEYLLAALETLLVFKVGASPLIVHLLLASSSKGLEELAELMDITTKKIPSEEFKAIISRLSAKYPAEVAEALEGMRKIRDSSQAGSVLARKFLEHMGEVKEENDGLDRGVPIANTSNGGPLAESDNSKRPAVGGDSAAAVRKVVNEMPITSNFDYVDTTSIARYSELDPNKRAEVVRYVVGRIAKNASPEYVAFLDHIIDNGDHEARLAVLLALKTLDADNVDERMLVRYYLRLIEKSDVRDRAITEGARNYNLPHRMVKYLIDEDAKNLRDPAHRFMVDQRPFYETENDVRGAKSEPPIIRYGVPLLEKGEIELVRYHPGVLTSQLSVAEDVAQQCNETIDILYAERRKRVGLVQLGGGFIPFRTYNDFWADDHEQNRDVDGLGGVFDYLTSEYENGARLLLGGQYDDFGDDGLSLGGRIGPAWQISSDFMFKFPLVVSYFRIKGTGDMGPELPLERESATEPYHFSPGRFTERGVSLVVDPEILYSWHRWKLGEGKTLGLHTSIGMPIGLYWASLSDDDCKTAIDPRGKDITVNNNRDVTIRGARSGSLCRDGEDHFGYTSELRTMLGLEYQW